MKKKALRKDFLVEIKKTFNRFISIFFIVALGVAFFVGIRSTEPDMKLSGDKYFDESNLMDIRVLSSLGLTDDDVASIKGVKGVKDAVGAYSADLLCNAKDKEFVIKLMSYPTNINKTKLVDGRIPKNDTECVVDTAFLQSSGYKIGDTIHFKSGTDDKLSDTLKRDHFTIVGSVTSSYFLDMDRGTSKIGNGTVDSFIMVPNKAFSLSVYTEIYLLVDHAANLTSYSKEYNDLLKTVVHQIEDTIMDSRVEARYNDVISKANKKLQDAKDKYESGKEKADSKLSKAKRKLDKAKKDIDKSKDKIESNEQKLQDAKIEIDKAKAKLIAARSQLEESKLTIASKERELSDGKNKLQQGTKTYSTSKDKYDTSIKQLTNAKKLIAEKAVELKIAESRLKKGKEELVQKEGKLKKAKEDYLTQLEQAKQLVLSKQLPQSAVDEMIVTATAKFRAADTQITTAKKTITSNETKLVTGRKEIEEAKKMIQENQAKLHEANIKLQKAKAKIDVSKAAIRTGESKLQSAKASLLSNEKKLNTKEDQLEPAKTNLATGIKQLNEGKVRLQNGEKDYKKGYTEYLDAKEKATKKLADAKEKIEDGKKDIKNLDKPEWYVLDRNKLQTYVEFGQDAERVGAIGKVFPAIFFLVAALVSLTTMTRMVEEKRTEIGTLKALGYGKSSIIMKYLFYALFATISGSIFGSIVGSFVFPRIIINAYRIMYQNLPYIVAPINAYYFIMATVIAVACVVLATLFACYKELLSSPSTLMRPIAPKQGKKVLLERIPFIWKKLNFSKKATVRNLVRYKKRFFMTVFGIGGCMALLLVGFGLKDSIFSIVSLQYNELHLYDQVISLDDDSTDKDKEALEQSLLKDKRITDHTYLYSNSIEVTNGKSEKSAYLNVFKDTSTMNKYVIFRDRETKKSKKINDDGIFITEKLAKLLDLREGDTFYLKDGETQKHKVEISGIVENYVQHYIYMTPKLYENIYKSIPKYNEVLLFGTNRDSKKDNELGAALLELPSITNVSYISNISDSYGDMLGSLNIVIVVLIISAGGLAFVVLYNLNNININERRRELATIKVLGFYDLEVSEYVYRENVVLTLIGAIVGVVLGIVLHRFVILTAEVDMIMFGRLINWKSYLYSVLLTFLFSILINMFMHFKLKDVDMVESLKSVE